MEGDSGLIHYYYINYKHFVNVVKYKLDQIRKKIETEEKRVSISASMYSNVQFQTVSCWYFYIIKSLKVQFAQE